MKIDHSLNSIGNIANGSHAANAAKTPRATPTKEQTTDVALSQLSATLQNVDDTMASSVANSEKVAQIRAAIAQGNFKIDTSKIADGLINSVRQMLQAQS